MWPSDFLYTCKVQKRTVFHYHCSYGLLTMFNPCNLKRSTMNFSRVKMAKSQSYSSLMAPLSNKPIGCCSISKARTVKGKHRQIFMSASPECLAADWTAHHEVKAADVPSPHRQHRPLVIAANLILPSKMTMMESGANPRYAFRTEYFPVAPIDRYCYLPPGSVR